MDKTLKLGKLDKTQKSITINLPENNSTLILGVGNDNSTSINNTLIKSDILTNVNNNNSLSNKFANSNIDQIVLNNAQVVHTHNDTIDKVTDFLKDQNLEITQKEINTIVNEASNNVLESIVNLHNNKVENLEDNTYYKNISLVTSEVNPVNIEKFINHDVFTHYHIILNMSPNLCNKSVCYLKCDIYADNTNKIYKTIYVQYYNTTGLTNKQLYKFSVLNNTDKNILQNGYLKITAHQLINCEDANPYIIGKFKLSNFKHKINDFQLYKIINIDSVFNFSFNKLTIYPTKAVGTTWKLKTQNYLNLSYNGIIVNNSKSIILTNVGLTTVNIGLTTTKKYDDLAIDHTNSIEIGGLTTAKKYDDLVIEHINSIDVNTLVSVNNSIESNESNYVFDYNHIKDNTINKLAIRIYYEKNTNLNFSYNNFVCNLILYLQNGDKFVLPSVKVVNTGTKYLHLAEPIIIDKTQCNLDNVVKFSLTNLKYEQKWEMSDSKYLDTNIALAKQGNIYNKY